MIMLAALAVVLAWVLVWFWLPDALGRLITAICQSRRRP